MTTRIINNKSRARSVPSMLLDTIMELLRGLR